MLFNNGEKNENEINNEFCNGVVLPFIDSLCRIGHASDGKPRLGGINGRGKAHAHEGQSSEIIFWEPRIAKALSNHRSCEC
jgi:hypothetical protein